MTLELGKFCNAIGTVLLVGKSIEKKINKLILKIKILMIDDHPMTLKGYEMSLIDYSQNLEFEIFKAYNSAEAIELLKLNVNDPFQIIFLDIKLPISQELNLISGEELGIKIKKDFKAKIIVISSIGSPERVHGIIQNLQPDGYITKVETTPEVLIEAIDICLSNEKYYCRNVKNIFRIKDSTDDFLDKVDLKILYLISTGEKMKNMSEYVPLSLASIERRKRKIKIYLGVNGSSDKELILRGKEKGFL